MLLTDIDNIMYKIEAENDYEDFCKEIALCDFRNYQKDSKYCNNPKNLVVGKTKYEACDVPIKGFVRLKSKTCTFMSEDNHESKKTKCINKNIFDDELRYEDQKIVLFNRSHVSDKKIVCLDRYSRLSHFHKSTP